MVRTVYVDILFLINFSMDFLCFSLVSVLFCRKTSPIRIALASALGGAYAVLSLFFPFGGILLLLSDMLSCLLMCFVKELGNPIKPVPLLREAIVYTGVSMTLGGIMTATYRALNEIGIPESLSDLSDGVSAWLFLLLALIGGGASLFGSRFLRRGISEKTYYAEVHLLGRRACFPARIDSGNLLTDPISGCPAAAIDLDAARRLLPELGNAVHRSPSEILPLLPPALRSRARLLPVTSVTGEGILLAFRTDGIRISEREDASEGEQYALLLAVSSVKLDGIELLLPPSILTNGALSR
jgi:stage II sporulation protein GA (sporulation sigma-E factor processing peptidase)